MFGLRGDKEKEEYIKNIAVGVRFLFIISNITSMTSEV